MPLEKHLMSGEDVLEFCTTDYWTWVCTDQRVLKFKQGKSGGEQLHDISFDEISGISYTNRGRNDRLGGFGGVAIVGSIGLMVALPPASIIGLPLLGLGIYLMYRWWTSPGSFFAFRGSGLVQENPEQWRIQEDAADDSEEIREFVMAVREQL